MAGTDAVLGLDRSPACAALWQALAAAEIS
jgi:hypothetical protein